MMAGLDRSKMKPRHCGDHRHGAGKEAVGQQNRGEAESHSVRPST